MVIEGIAIDSQLLDNLVTPLSNALTALRMLNP